jgi:hypothetical protein
LLRWVLSVPKLLNIQEYIIVLQTLQKLLALRRTQTLNEGSKIIVRSTGFSVSTEIFDDRSHSFGSTISFLRRKLESGKCGTAVEEEFHLGKRSVPSPAFVNTRSWVEMSLDFSLDLTFIPLSNYEQLRCEQ